MSAPAAAPPPPPSSDEELIKLREALTAARMAAGWPQKKSRHIEAIIAASAAAFRAMEREKDDAERSRERAQEDQVEAEERADNAEGGLMSLLAALADYRRGMADADELAATAEAATDWLSEQAWKTVRPEDILAPR